MKLRSDAGACVIQQFLPPVQAAASFTAHAITYLQSHGRMKGQLQRTLIAQCGGMEPTGLSSKMLRLQKV